MKRSKAINKYINGHVHAEEIIRRIMKWNHKLSIPENARALGLNNDTIRPFVFRYKLKYKKCGQGNNYGNVRKEVNKWQDY